MQCDIKPFNLMMSNNRQSLRVIEFAIDRLSQVSHLAASALTLLYEQSEACSRVFAGTH